MEAYCSRFRNEEINNFVKYLVEERVSGDKKEVIKADYLKRHLYEIIPNERRVATSTIWNRLARNFDVITVNVPIVIKNITQNGMSKILLKLEFRALNQQRTIMKSTLVIIQKHIKILGMPFEHQQIT